VPLTARAPAPPVNEQNRWALTKLEVLQFEPVVLKERNGSLPTDSSRSIGPLSYDEAKIAEKLRKARRSESFPNLTTDLC
jgi:hypothetical protein